MCDRDDGCGVRRAVLARRATRDFLPDPVPREVIADILDCARRAPSGGNLQPWRVHVLTGPALAAFVAQVAEQFAAGAAEPPEHAVYPPGLWEPYRGRRGRAGAQRYEALGLDRRAGGQEELTRRNYRFFGAPAGLFFTIERRMGAAQWTDLGMYMQTVMLLATERGLATCPQAVWTNWPLTVRRCLALPETEMLVAGMALGRPAPSPINDVETERAPLDDFVRWHHAVGDGTIST